MIRKFYSSEAYGTPSPQSPHPTPPLLQYINTMFNLYRYVPALRLLRQQAFVLTFPPTVPGRLAQRLMEVSAPQSLKVHVS